MLAFNTNLTAEQRVAKATMALDAHRKWVPFMAVGMIGQCYVVEDGVLPHNTMATDGRDVWYCRSFVDSIRDSDLRFGILHERYHKALEHLTTWDYLTKIDPQCTNVSMDHVINLQIMDIDDGEGFVTLPLKADGTVMVCFDVKYRGMDTLQIFNILREQEGDDPDGPAGGGGDRLDGGDSEDDPDGPAGSGGDGPEGDDSEDGPSGNGGGYGGFDDHDWEGARKLTTEEVKKLGTEIAEALREGSMAAGQLGGSGAEVGFDKMLEPQVDWREVLRDFISSTCSGNDFSTYARPNRRYMSTGVYMPSGISQRVDTLVLAIDTSGSVSQPEISLMLAEVKSICDIARPEKVTILYWGSNVVRREDYDDINMHTLIDSTKPKDGGGTRVECVPDFMREHNIEAQAVVVFTDGYVYAGWGKWDCPVLWTVLDNKQCQPDIGKVCHVSTQTR